MPTSGALARIIASASMPLWPGIDRSMMITSSSVVRTRSIASRPLAASPTTRRSTISDRNCLSPARTMAWSSTIPTLTIESFMMEFRCLSSPEVCAAIAGRRGNHHDFGRNSGFVLQGPSSVRGVRGGPGAVQRSLEGLLQRIERRFIGAGLERLACAAHEVGLRLDGGRRDLLPVLSGFLQVEAQQFGLDGHEFAEV